MERPWHIKSEELGPVHESDLDEEGDKQDADECSDEQACGVVRERLLGARGNGDSAIVGGVVLILADAIFRGFGVAVDQGADDGVFSDVGATKNLWRFRVNSS
jgi:hypothetical protein